MKSINYRRVARLLIFNALSISLILLLLFASSFAPEKLTQQALARLQANPGPSIVSVSGRQLLVSKRNSDGTLAPPAPFTIKGVVWSSASPTTNTSTFDPNNANVRRPEFGIWAATDIPLIKAMNANTVRMLIDPGPDATGRAVLDQLYNQGIMVIMTVDDAINNTARAQQVVNYYKDHPAILMWSLGSEWNINRYFGVASSVQDAAQRTQTAAALIKTLDTNHPVATSYGDIDINGAGLTLSDTQNYVNNICPSVDVWALNIYRSNDFGILFSQWKFISTKPMFIGEFGTDAFHTTNYPATCPVNGFVDEPAQANWDLGLWNDLFWNLSASYPNKAALGGTVFEWNDEWWKVQPWQSQEACGHDKNPGGHPDIVANEEYFGIVDIARHPRQVYTTLQTAFNPTYQPPNQPVTFSAVSAGGDILGTCFDGPAFAEGYARFFRGTLRFYCRTGGGGGGRGFNVAAINPCTYELIQPVQNFDTYKDAFILPVGCEQTTAMLNFLNSLPNGTLILIAVGDEAGLAGGPPSCTPITNPQLCVNQLRQTLQNLGSQLINSYCFRDSFAMITIKGTGVALAEQKGHAAPVTVETALSALATVAPINQSFSASGGNGSVNVTAAGSCGWTAVSNASWITITFGINGSGNSIVSFSVAANIGPARIGTLTIAGHTFTVNQAGKQVKKADFDSDGKTDIAIWRPSTGVWWILNSSTNQYRAQGWGFSGDVPVPGDYDNDGRADIAVWRPSTGVWWILYSSTGQYRAQQWGYPTDVPVPGDYDGDGKTDIAIWRPGDGVWWILFSLTNQYLTQQWGYPGDVPVAGDYDGDGKTDIAIWRPSTGVWWILFSSTNQYRAQGWGFPGDIPVPGNYDNDGKADMAVWRPSTGVWWILFSSTGQYRAQQWGYPSDVPVPGDYDNDGKTDIAIWRPGDGVWWILNSSTNQYRTQQWGYPGDVPVPSVGAR